jgi:hypothetical protein
MGKVDPAKRGDKPITWLMQNDTFNLIEIEAGKNPF